MYNVIGASVSSLHRESTDSLILSTTILSAIPNTIIPYLAIEASLNLLPGAFSARTYFYVWVPDPGLPHNMAYPRGALVWRNVLLTQQKIVPVWAFSRKRIDANYRGSKTAFMWLYLP